MALQELGVGLLHRCLCLTDLRVGLLQLCSISDQRDLEITGIQLNERLTRLNVPIIVHQNLLDGSGDTRTNLVSVSRDVSVIGILVSGSVLPVPVTKEEDDQQDHPSD